VRALDLLADEYRVMLVLDPDPSIRRAADLLEARTRRGREARGRAPGLDVFPFSQCRA